MNLLAVSSDPTKALILLAFILLIFGGLVTFVIMNEKSVLEKRFSFRDADPEQVAEWQRQESFTHRVLLPFINGISHFLSKRMQSGGREQLQRKMLQAGTPLDAGQFLLLQGASLVAGLILGIVLALLLKFQGMIFIGAPLATTIFGYIAPRTMIDRRIKKRKAEVLRSLPSAIDVMIMCVKAGMSFESALAEVSTPVGETGADTGICEILRHEFEAAFQSIKLGRPMVEALKAIGDNTGVAEVTHFVNSVAHAEEFGTPIADILDQQSDDLRRERRQQAQEKGQKAGLKMLFPLIGCMFPTIFMLLGGPAILEVLKIMGPK